MGVNAQTAVPAFEALEVLTAAEMTQVNTGIPVFATTVTRDAAFGGAGEKVLAEGQFAYIEATNTTQYYDGATWQTVGVTPGLVCVQAETAFTTASSVTADNVFTSSYTNYVLNLTITSSSAELVLLYKNRVGGVSASTDYNAQRVSFSAASTDAARITAQTSFRFGQARTVRSFFALNIESPQLATQTNFFSNGVYNDNAATVPIAIFNTGNHSTATAYDGFEILTNTGTISGFYSVYGFSKTV
jgi:hypothetical protein